SKTNPKEWTNISRPQLLKWVANGEIPILIGTHSLIQKSVEFENLALVIIDEQHKFGTKQRMKITKKSEVVPHLLSMTATPIPRTLALTIYGDLDLTLLDQMPTGRKPVITEIITPEKRSGTYDFIKNKLEEGRQMYVICPRIEEPDPDKAGALRVKSVRAEAKRLKEEIFPEYEIDILHSKMKPAEKDDVMKRYEDGEIDILVSTSVVEVGVNVPNATMIIIEGAERFGLAQLHQLRGRVLRSNHQAHCFVFSDTKSDHSLERLKALKTAKNGFELAEQDLMLRGAGELSGKKQWGISDLGMEAIKNIKMIEASRTEALDIIEKDFELKKYPLIAERLEGMEVHFE
ncbi:helicase-related protein, partial [Patescibacteria group bacterium]